MHNGFSSDLDVKTLRELFRNLQAFQSLYEDYGVDTIVGPDGREWCLWDIWYLYDQRSLLSPRQCQAIELCLFENHTEESSALMMGVSPTNPVAMYATDGLRKIVAMAQAGTLSRYAKRTREGAA